MKTQTVIAPLPSCSNTAVRGETSKINHSIIMKNKRKNLFRPLLSLAAGILSLAAPMCAKAVIAVNDSASIPENAPKQSFPSVLRADNAVFNGNDIFLELAKPQSLPELSTALDCFIECANLGLRSWGGSARSSTALVPGAIRSRV